MVHVLTSITYPLLGYAKCYYFTVLTYRYLNYSITKLRKQDTLSVLVYVSQNVHGRYLAWNFVRNNWNYISETLVTAFYYGQCMCMLLASFLFCGRSKAWKLCNTSNAVPSFCSFGEGSFFDRVILYITSAFSTDLELYEVSIILFIKWEKSI